MTKISEQPSTAPNQHEASLQSASPEAIHKPANVLLKPDTPLSPDNLLQMQRVYGNHFVVQRLLEQKSGVIQRQDGPTGITTVDLPTAEEQREQEREARADALAEFPEALSHLQELLQEGNTAEALTYLDELHPYVYPHLMTRREVFAHTTYPSIDHHELFRMRAIIQFGSLIPSRLIERFIEHVRNQEIEAVSEMLQDGLGEDDSPAELLRQGFLDVTHYLEVGLPTSPEHVRILMNPDVTARDYLTQGQTLEEERATLIRLLGERNASGFTARLRMISDDIAEALDQDADFIVQMAQHLHGFALFTSRMLLRFGQSEPHYIRQFQLAVSDHNVSLLQDLLRAYPELGRDAPGAREVLLAEFEPSDERTELLHLLGEQPLQSDIYFGTHAGAHYEPPTGGPIELSRRSGTEEFTITRTASELRVIIHIHFLREGDTTEIIHPPTPVLSEWRAGIEDVWNNRFEAFNGSTLLRLVFVPIFNDEEHGADQTVRISDESTDDLRETESHWARDTSGRTAAHEFGHILGNPDEYNLPQTRQEISDAGIELDEEDMARTNVQDIVGDDTSEIEETDERGTDLLGIMGSPHGEDYAPRPRHVQHIVEWYNVNLKPDSESDYHVTNLSR